ncbi:MFS transporter [Cryobacterium sp. TMS1-20-1]|uniref:MFS transporter n=1 Tax=Cryobacterium sp. TMS1-20-1 TaxID=1259223 RepID=UPI00141B0854|nr:MFS transporter [Cryobacterium sp. TMS1-20-1]
MALTNTMSTPEITTSPRRAAITAGLGTFIEGYDLSVYGYTAIFLAPLIFPSGDPIVSLLLSLGVFALAYVARPLGGIIFGHFGDRISGKAILVITISTMGIATSVIAFIPTYAQVGLVAPIVLLLCRLVQGFSVGGEVAGATTYVLRMSPAEKRSRYGAFNPLGASIGFAGASAITGFVSGIVTPEQMAEWGWRIPFLVALPLTIICFAVRRRISTDVEDKVAPAKRVGVKLPFAALLHDDWRALLKTVLIAMAVNAASYLGFTYMSIYLISTLGYPATPVYWFVTAGIALSAIAMLFTGRLGDKVGLKPLAVIGLVGYGALTIPVLAVMGLGSLPLAALAFLVFVLNASFLQVAAYSMLPMLFQPHLRMSGMGLGYSLGAVIAGGTAPFFAVWLVQTTGMNIAPGFFIIAVVVIALITMAFVRVAEPTQPLEDAVASLDR